MKKIHSALFMLILITVLVSGCKTPPSQVEANTQNKGALENSSQSTHPDIVDTDTVESEGLHASRGDGAMDTYYSREVSGSFVQLRISANVSRPEQLDELRQEYNANYLVVDHVLWKNAVFGADADKAVHMYDTMNQATKDAYGYTEEFRENEFAYEYEGVTTWYQRDTAQFFINIHDQEKSYAEGMISTVENKQSSDLDMTPAEAIDMANAFITPFGFTNIDTGRCYTISRDKDGIREDEIYIIEFRRQIKGANIAIDETSVSFPSDLSLPIKGDYIRVYIDKDGVYKVHGFYRELEEVPSTDAAIMSVAEAIPHLESNADFVEAYNETGVFDISQIELCYVPVQVLRDGEPFVTANINYRLAWRFASELVRQGRSSGFVIYIDSETGEVLSR